MASFFDDLSGKVAKFGQDATKKTKNFADSVKINGQINEQKTKLSGLYEDLGRKVYTGNCVPQDAQFDELVQMIRDNEQQMQVLLSQLSEAKGEVKCKQCGGSVPVGNMFCQHCGNKMEVPQPEQNQQTGTGQTGQKFCMKCGSPLEEGHSFCTKCGEPIQMR